MNPATHCNKSVHAVCLSTVSQNAPTNASFQCFVLLFVGSISTPTLGAALVASWASLQRLLLTLGTRICTLVYWALHISYSDPWWNVDVIYLNAFFPPSEGYTHCKYTTEACLSATKPIAHTESRRRFATTDLRHLLVYTIAKSVAVIRHTCRSTDWSGSGVKLCTSTCSVVDVPVHKELWKTTRS